MGIHINNAAHLGAFTALNLQWIEQLFQVEASDRKMLERPEWIVEQGGCIITLTLADEVVGYCALLKGKPGHFELAKMAVKPEYQGRGLSGALMREAIAQGLAHNAKILDLLTSSTLTRAISIYKAHGFEVLPTKCHPDYARCDVIMQLKLQ